MSIRLRPYVAADEDAAIALWQRTWQIAYPQIAFGKRLDWWRGRWRDDLVPVATIVIAERDGAMIGFVTIDQKTGYLDQLVVAPEFWRSGIGRILVDEAKRLSPEKSSSTSIRTTSARLRCTKRWDFRSPARASASIPACRFM